MNNIKKPFSFVSKPTTNVPFIINNKANQNEPYKEIWKEVISLKNVLKNYTFFISSTGRVKQCSLYDLNDIKLISPTLDEKDYFLYFTLSINTSIELIIKIHNIMAEVFIPKPSHNHNIVNHINGKNYDNDLSNLEWVCGEGDIDKKLSVFIIDERGASSTRFNTVGDAADITGLPEHLIEDLCLNNECEYGCYWKFVKDI